MTDMDHAAAIRETAKALNDAIAKAANSGLTVKVSASESMSVLRVPFVLVTLSRPVPV